jgi:hypothetical protein
MKYILTLLLLFIVQSTVAAEKFSVAACAQDSTSSQVISPIDNMTIAVPALGNLVTVRFKGDFVTSNRTQGRREVGGTIFLMRDGAQLDRAQVWFPVNSNEGIALPMSLHVFDQPPAGTHIYSVLWAALSANNIDLKVNCRLLTAIVEGY